MPKLPHPPATPPADPARPAQRVSLKSLFKAVFVDQVQLRREGTQLKLGLGTRVDPASDATPAPPPPETPAQAMHRGLAGLLDNQAGSRQVLRHLATLEHHLGRNDLGFFEQLSLASVQTMIRQLHGLIALPAAPEIQKLLQCLLDAAELQTRLEQQRAHSHPISSFFVDHKMEVREMTDVPSELMADFAPGGESKRPPG